MLISFQSSNCIYNAKWDEKNEIQINKKEKKGIYTHLFSKIEWTQKTTYRHCIMRIIFRFFFLSLFSCLLNVISTHRCSVFVVEWKNEVTAYMRAVLFSEEGKRTRSLVESTADNGMDHLLTSQTSRFRSNVLLHWISMTIRSQWNFAKWNRIWYVANDEEIPNHGTGQ